ncbi:MAG: ATP-binding protein [bacterium]
MSQIVKSVHLIIFNEDSLNWAVGYLNKRQINIHRFKDLASSENASASGDVILLEDTGNAELYDDIQIARLAPDYPEIIILNGTKNNSRLNSLYESGHIFHCFYKPEKETDFFCLIDRAVSAGKGRLNQENIYSKIAPFEKQIQELKFRINVLERSRNFSENVMHAVTSGMLVLDNELNIIFLNGEGKNIFNVETADYLGVHLFDIQKPLIKEIKNDIKSVLKSDETISRVRLKVGEDTYISYSIFIIRDKDKNRIGLLIIGNNITENELIKEQLHQSDKLATIGTMLSGIAHELRNPLTIINARAQRMEAKSSNLDDRMKRSITSIAEQSERCGRIVDNLLKFVRKESWGFSYTDINQLLDEAIYIFKLDPKSKDIEIKCDYCKNSHAYLDRTQIIQMFLNLFTNASDAMEGKGVLEIATRKSQRFIKAIVKDNGPGIPKQYYNKIFDPFFTTKSMGKGTGLGLSIVMRIVEMHKGRIQVDTMEGCTIFEIDLPLIKQ